MAYRNRTSGLAFGFGITPWVLRLIIANTVVWLASLAFPMISEWLAFIPALTLARPWTIVTYMFVHGGFLHLFFNMLVLFFFGPPLESMWGGKEFLRFYFISGLGGALFSYLFAFNAGVIGASAAIYGVMLAFAMNWPNMPIYIWGILPVKAKWLVAFAFAISFLSIAGQTIGGAPRDHIAHFAHLGGFAAAFVYLKAQSGLTDRFKRLGKFVKREKSAVARGGGGARVAQRRPRRRNDDRVLDEVDRVLEKISKSGLQSLSPEEMKLLDEVSKRYRQN